MLSERGHWLRREDGIDVLITVHPSALLRGEPSERESAYEAWLADLSAASGRLAKAMAHPE